MEAMKELKDLVPPRELCEHAAEVIGDKTALVYKQVPYKYKDGIVVKKKWIICKRFDGREPQIPAPTLAELLEMLPVGQTGLCTIQSIANQYAGCKIDTSGAKNADDIYELEESDNNPATAALRLLMKVKGA